MCQNLDSCILINYNYTLQRVKWIHDSVDNNDSAHLPENLPKNRTEIVASTPIFSFSPFCLPVTLRWISNVCYYVLFPFIFTIPPRCLNPLYGWSTHMYYDSYCCLNRSEYWQWHHRIYSKRLLLHVYLNHECSLLYVTAWVSLHSCAEEAQRLFKQSNTLLNNHLNESFCFVWCRWLLSRVSVV